jgi:hypothetical protein
LREDIYKEGVLISSKECNKKDRKKGSSSNEK